MKQQQNIIVKYIPITFILLWATGFLGARYAMPYAEPFAFLTIRFAVTLLILGSAAFFLRTQFPKGKALIYALITGALIHTIYLWSVFWSIKQGFPVGFVGIIIGLQPIITALLAMQIIKDKITKTQILGLIIGFFGVGLVLLPNGFSNFDKANLLFAFVVLLGIIVFSLGTVLQKKYSNEKTLLGTIIAQYVGALALSLPLVLMFETFTFEWNGQLIFAFIWLVLVLSIGAIILLMIMIKAGEATKTATYFYLVPVITAITAYFLFGETLNAIQIFGMIIVSAGVMLATIFSTGFKRKN
ncbi:MAG: DMT family transporter [Devosiaceae bacterium]|nr:DMT family transporter [Devosiaceae bacterium]